MMANELRAAGNTLRSSEHAPAASDLDLNIHFRPPSINNSHARSALSEQSSGGGGGGGGGCCCFVSTIAPPLSGLLGAEMISGRLVECERADAPGAGA